MGKRSDYRRKYLDMTIQELHVHREKQLDKMLAFDAVLDTRTAEQAFKEICYLDNRIKKMTEKKQKI